MIFDISLHTWYVKFLLGSTSICFLSLFFAWGGKRGFIRRFSFCKLHDIFEICVGIKWFLVHYYSLSVSVFFIPFQWGPCISLGELQGQPTIWHLNRAPSYVLWGHAAGCVLSVPTGLGPVEPTPCWGRCLWLYSCHHRWWHRPPLCWCHPLGGDRCLCRRGRCSQTRYYTDFHTDWGKLVWFFCEKFVL